MNAKASSGLRIDKWLWYARFFKTRSAATKMVSSGKLRLDGQVMAKPHRQVLAGQILTFQQASQIRVVKVEQLGSRRGPASEAALLYTDLAPPQQKADTQRQAEQPQFEQRSTGSGRPTKKDRRSTEKLKDPFADS